MGMAVQFKGVEQTIRAFEMKGIPAWSFWCGTNMLHKCEAETMEESEAALREWFDVLGSSSNAVYTIKFYENPGGKISYKTPPDGSFNIRLNLDDQELSVGQYRQLSSQHAILEELAALRKDLAELKAKDDEDDEDDQDNSIAGKIIDHPLTGAVIGKIFGLDAKQDTKTALGNVPGSERTIEQSIEVLQQYDKNLRIHLYKLSRIAEIDRKGFDFLLNMLDNMNV